MSDFSEYLDNYMNENSITSTNLAIEIGVDRTLIHRYRKGTRVPSDDRKVLDIADALRMNTTEKKMLLDKFDLVNLGESVVYNYQYMKNLLSNLQEAINKQVNFIPQIDNTDYFEKSNIVRLDSKEILLAFCADWFTQIKEKDGVVIRMIFQPVYDEILTLILNILGNLPNAKIEHILCLEKSPQKSFMNLEILGKAIPLVFSDMDYNAFYYYDSLINHVNATSLFPNMIIINDIVLQFNYDMSSGTVIKDIGYSESMREEFEKIHDMTEQLMFNNILPLDWLETYNKLNRETVHSYSIYFQPCFGYCSSTDLFEKYLFPIPDRDKFIKCIEEHHGDWDGMKWIPPKYNVSKVTAYCKESGVRDFMETGRIGELPDAIYDPLNMEVRKTVIKRLVHLIKSDEIDIIFIDEGISLSNKIYIYWNDKNRVFLHKHNMMGFQQIDINSSGLYQSIQDFLTYMEKKNMIMTKEEVINRIEKIVSEYN